MYLITHIVIFRASRFVRRCVAILGKVTDIPCEPRLAADELGGSEYYNMSEEVH